MLKSNASQGWKKQDLKLSCHVSWIKVLALDSHVTSVVQAGNIKHLKPSCYSVPFLANISNDFCLNGTSLSRKIL